MIVAGTYPPIHIDLGKDKPGMTLQYWSIERGTVVWRDYIVGGEPLQHPLILISCLLGFIV